MGTLYDISQDYVHLIEGGFIVDAETGEITFDSTNIDDKRDELGNKLESVACYIKNLLAEAEAIKAEENALAERRRAKERKADNLRDYMLNCMRLTDIRKLDTPRVLISTRKSQRLEVTDEELVRKYAPMVFNPQPDKLNKAKLRKIIKGGATVAGAELIDTETLQIK